MNSSRRPGPGKGTKPTETTTQSSPRRAKRRNPQRHKSRSVLSPELGAALAEYRSRGHDPDALLILSMASDEEKVARFEALPASERARWTVEQLNEIDEAMQREYCRRRDGTHASRAAHPALDLVEAAPQLDEADPNPRVVATHEVSEGEAEVAPMPDATPEQPPCAERVPKVFPFDAGAPPLPLEAALRHAAELAANDGVPPGSAPQPPAPAMAHPTVAATDAALPEPSIPTVEATIVPANGAATSFAEICSAVRSRVNSLKIVVVRAYVEIADMIAAAKVAYDNEHDTGRVGKRNPRGVPGFNEACSIETKLSESMIAKYLHISKMSAEQRALVTGAETFTALYELSSATDPERMLALVTPKDVARAAEGSPLLERAAREPEVDKLIKSFSDKGPRGLGHLADEHPIPKELLAKIPEFAEYPNCAAVRKADEDRKTMVRRKLVREPDRNNSRPVGKVVQVRLRVGPDQAQKVDTMHSEKPCRHKYVVARVCAPRAVLTAALKATEDNGDKYDEAGNLVSSNPEAKVIHETPELLDAIVYLTIH